MARVTYVSKSLISLSKSQMRCNEKRAKITRTWKEVKIYSLIPITHLDVVRYEKILSLVGLKPDPICHVHEN
jgi:hypothetical protein